jgi:Kef-type K+ transport system membrane component KefB
MIIGMFLFLGIVFLLTFLVGRLIERIRVPWIFAALLLGSFLAIYNPFHSVTSSQTFNFLAQLGMYFLLFIIGFEINLNKLKRAGRFIIKATFFIIFLEGFFGGLLVHFVFGYDWLISFIVALSFATVGEAILIPILDEFRIVNTKLGQSIIGIGTLDDLIELFLLIGVVFVVGYGIYTQFNTSLVIISLFVLFALTFGLTKLKEENKKFGFLSIEHLFLFTLFILFLFLGIGEYAHATPIAALLSGIALKTFVPKKRLKKIENQVRAICYGFFAPIFFLWVGATMDMNYVLTYFPLVLLVVAVSKGAKILGSYVVGRKELGFRRSILLGIGLSVRFSTSIIIIKILFENNIIGPDLYSVIVASSIAFKFIVPVLFSNLLVRWNIGKAKQKI